MTKTIEQILEEKAERIEEYWEDMNLAPLYLVRGIDPKKVGMPANIYSEKVRKYK